MAYLKVVHTFFCFRHLKSHVHEEYIDVDKLSEPQMIMQHFRNYDLDKNGNIDGLEILKAAHKMNGNYFKQYSTQNWMPKLQIYAPSCRIQIQPRLVRTYLNSKNMVKYRATCPIFLFKSHPLYLSLFVNSDQHKNKR